MKLPGSIVDNLSKEQFERITDWMDEDPEQRFLGRKDYNILVGIILYLNAYAHNLEGASPDYSDCVNRGTSLQEECARQGCGFCLAAENKEKIS